MIVHLNGRFMDAGEARVSPFDRAYLFGDAVYEGLRAFGGRVVGMGRHVERLRRSLQAIRLEWDAERLAPLTDALLEANGLRDAFIYWQVSRGVPDPDQPVRERILGGSVRPAVFGFAHPTPALGACVEPDTTTAAVAPDTRWTRGLVKSTSLLGGVLACYEAHDAGAREAVLVRDGLVAESAASNVALVTEAGEIATPSLESVPILAGVTRAILLEAAPEVVARPVREEELGTCRELMIIGTTRLVTAITRLDGRTIGDGRPGPEARRLHRVLLEATRRDLGLD